MKHYFWLLIDPLNLFLFWLELTVLSHQTFGTLCTMPESSFWSGSRQCKPNLMQAREAYPGPVTTPGRGTVYLNPGAVRLQWECMPGQHTKSRKKGCNARTPHLSSRRSR
ncbi:hypothetical protein AMECASPLE_019080 [Ameca splendens]|uniref:Secreted protein n=1 Tax=Ameca splendens TaxID=208324 RepID=A0ABV1AAP1_9TELE